MMIKAVEHDLASRWNDPKAEGMHLMMAHTMNDEAIQEFSEEAKALFPGKEILIDPLPLSIAVHIGPGSLAFAVAKQFAF